MSKATPLLEPDKDMELETFTTAGDVSKHELDIDIVTIVRKPLYYRVSQSPPIHLLIVFALQQSLLTIASPLSTTIIVSEIVCAQKDDVIKTQILSATFFMVGLSTFTMCTFGIRLPIFQGPSSAYLIPLMTMSALDEWRCPETFEELDPITNSSLLMASNSNGTLVPMKEIIMEKIAKLSGSLVLAGGMHFLIGATGLVGVLIRYIGPVTIVPTIMLVGLYIYKLAVKLCEASWVVAIFTSAISLILSLFLANKQTPVPAWSKDKGFHIYWFPFHQVFSVLLSIVLGWIFSAILTVCGAFTDDPTSKEYMARIDARTDIIGETDWFTFPYPGKLSSISFCTGCFVSFLIATFLSVLDSIGDYKATARISSVTPPPKYAFNRGIAVEGIMSILSGSMGCCHATVSYGSNIGAIGMTKVASRRVFQVCGVIFVLFAVLGKVGAVFISIPYPVLGGTSVVIIGIFVGVVLSYLHSIDLRSTRNLAIIGIALLLGLMMPYWVQKNPHAINTGNAEVDTVIVMLLSNPSFVGGLFAVFMDNAVPGTLKERGLLDEIQELEEEIDLSSSTEYEDGPEVYRLPFIPDAFRKSKIAKYIPVIDYIGD